MTPFEPKENSTKITLREELEKTNTIIPPKEFIINSTDSNTGNEKIDYSKHINNLSPNTKKLSNKIKDKRIDIKEELKKIGIINKSKKNNILDVKLTNDKKKRRIKNKTSRKARKLNYKRTK
jgi:hypothetical protein